jgi:hypothetical protein
MGQEAPRSLGLESRSEPLREFPPGCQFNHLNQNQEWRCLTVEVSYRGGKRRMKNQSFHQRKIRIQETPKLDIDQLKARTINALNKLGQQKFSTEPGGYALDNWFRGVNVLLDEFEEKVGAAKLSPEYRASRLELIDRMSQPVPVSSIDEDASELRANISEIEGKVEAERVLVVSRISELKTAHARCLSDLKHERSPIAKQRLILRPLAGQKQDYVKGA